MVDRRLGDCATRGELSRRHRNAEYRPSYDRRYFMTRCERSRGSGENFSCRRAHARTTLMGSRTIYGRSVSVIRGVSYHRASGFMQRGGFHETPLREIDVLSQL